MFPPCWVIRKALSPFRVNSTGYSLTVKAGTDYLVILYSKKALNIAAIQATFEREQGSFPDRIDRT